MEKEIFVGYDNSKESSCMVIMERKGDRTLCINHKHGKEADELYNLLTGNGGIDYEDTI